MIFTANYIPHPTAPTKAYILNSVSYNNICLYDDGENNKDGCKVFKFKEQLKDNNTKIINIKVLKNIYVGDDDDNVFKMTFKTKIISIINYEGENYEKVNNIKSIDINQVSSYKINKNEFTKEPITKYNVVIETGDKEEKHEDNCGCDKCYNEFCAKN
jgi:hypothetical protein